MLIIKRTNQIMFYNELQKYMNIGTAFFHQCALAVASINLRGVLKLVILNGGKHACVDQACFTKVLRIKSENVT